MIKFVVGLFLLLLGATGHAINQTGEISITTCLIVGGALIAMGLDDLLKETK